jgi:signal transduction histidine kinase
LQRFDEARQIIHEVQARKLDDFMFHNALYALAFLGSDSAGMAEQLRSTVAAASASPPKKRRTAESGSRALPAF